MKITKDEVKYVANLARLDIDDASLEGFADQISEIIDYIDKLSRVDTAGVPPTSHAISLCNAFREDIVQEHLDRKGVFENAPEAADGTFIVPKVVG